MLSSLQQNQALLHVLPFQQSGRSSMVADNWWLTLVVISRALPELVVSFESFPELVESVEGSL